MSNLKVRQISSKLKSLFETNLDLYGIADHDKQRDVKILSRCLAAYAVYHASGCSLADASVSVWDGGDDNGIDAAFFDQAERQVVIVQSKFISSGVGEPEAKEISVFADGVKDLIEGNIDGFGERLHSKVQSIQDALMLPGTTVRIILVTTGSSSLAIHGTKKLQRLLDELNEGDDDGMATVENMGINEVFAGLSAGANSGKINLSATLLDWSRITHPHSAYFGIIDGSQLKAWWSQHGKRVVAKNIRHALGDTEVNLQIKNTANNDPEHFWYFNNGITLIADEATRAPASASSHATGNFEFKGASIVNGAQTVSTLAKVDNDVALGSVRVSVRIIVLKEAPETFGADVTRTNNLQNRVEGRDFVSSDSEQSRLKAEMSLEGVEYEFHRSGDFVPSDSICDVIEVTTALACSSGDPSHFVAAKTGIGRFFNDLSKAPYKALFNPKTTGARAFNAVRILRAVDGWIATKKLDSAKKSGYGWGLLVHGNRAIAASVFKEIGYKYLDATIEDFPTDYLTIAEAACERVYPKMLEVLDTEFPNRALAVLFKSPSNCKMLFDSV